MFGVEAALIAGATSGDETSVGGMVIPASCSDLTKEEVEENPSVRSSRTQNNYSTKYDGEDIVAGFHRFFEQN